MLFDMGMRFNKALTTETLLDMCFGDYASANEKLAEFGFRIENMGNRMIAVYPTVPTSAEPDVSVDDICQSCGGDLMDLVKADSKSFNQNTLNLIKSYADNDISGSGEYDNMEVEDNTDDVTIQDDIVRLESLADEMLELLSGYESREIELARVKVEEAFMWGTCGLSMGLHE